MLEDFDLRLDAVNATGDYGPPKVIPEVTVGLQMLDGGNVHVRQHVQTVVLGRQRANQLEGVGNGRQRAGHPIQQRRDDHG